MDISTLSTILNPADLHFLLCFGTILTIFIGFYYIAAKKQKHAMDKVNESLVHQQKTNQQLGLMLAEMRRQSRMLAELAQMDSMPYSEADDYSLEDGDRDRTSSFSQPALNAQSPNGNQYKLYVGNIDYAASESELASHFAPYGQVEFVNIPVNRYTGRARGFGFVCFGSLSEAERAMALHGSEFKGRQIQVNFAKERESA